MLAVATVFGLSIAELFTPLPDQRGSIVTAGGAVIKSAALAGRTAPPTAIAAQDAPTLVHESARLADTIPTLFGPATVAGPAKSKKERMPRSIE